MKDTRNPLTISDRILSTLLIAEQGTLGELLDDNPENILSINICSTIVQCAYGLIRDERC